MSFFILRMAALSLVLVINELNISFFSASCSVSGAFQYLGFRLRCPDSELIRMIYYFINCMTSNKVLFATMHRCVVPGLTSLNIVKKISNIILYHFQPLNTLTRRRRNSAPPSAPPWTCCAAWRTGVTLTGGSRGRSFLSAGLR